MKNSWFQTDDILFLCMSACAAIGFVSAGGSAVLDAAQQENLRPYCIFLSVLFRIAALALLILLWVRNRRYLRWTQLRTRPKYIQYSFRILMSSFWFMVLASVFAPLLASFLQ